MKLGVQFPRCFEFPKRLPKENTVLSVNPIPQIVVSIFFPLPLYILTELQEVST